MLNSDSIVTGLWTGCLGFDACVGHRFFSLPQHPDLLWGSPNPCPIDTGGSFLGGRTAKAWIWPHPYVQDFRLPLRSRWDPHPTGLLRYEQW